MVAIFSVAMTVCVIFSGVVCCYGIYKYGYQWGRKDAQTYMDGGHLDNEYSNSMTVRTVAGFPIDEDLAIANHEVDLYMGNNEDSAYVTESGDVYTSEVDYNRQQSTSLDDDRQKSTSMDFDRQQSASMDFDRQQSASMDFDRQQSTSMDYDRQPSASVYNDGETDDIGTEEGSVSVSIENDENQLLFKKNRERSEGSFREESLQSQVINEEGQMQLKDKDGGDDDDVERVLIDPHRRRKSLMTELEDEDLYSLSVGARN